MNKLTLLSSLSFLLLSGCISKGVLEKNVKLESGDETVFVFGVQPDNFRISVFPGSVKDGEFKQNPFRTATVYSAASDGYVLGKANAGETLAITNIRFVSAKGNVLGSDFKPCEGTKALVFDVPPGKVIYITDVRYFFSQDDGLNYKYTANLEAAQQYIDSNYPNLKGRLEIWDYRQLPVSESCTTNIYVPSTPHH